MTAPAVFDYNGQHLRSVVVADAVWFVAGDACRLLDHTNVTMAVAGLDDDEKGLSIVETPGGSQQVTVVSEAGLYSLILRSRKAEAKLFKRWITHEVLPAIRKTGTYGQVEQFAIPKTYAEALELAAAQTRALEQSEAKVAELEPQAAVASKLLDADGDLSVADAAQTLTRAGIKVGGQRLFRALEIKGWIHRHKGDGRWRVYQAAIEGGWMSVIPQSHYHPKTGVLVLDPPQPRITPKGLQRLLTEHGAA